MNKLMINLLLIAFTNVAFAEINLPILGVNINQNSIWILPTNGKMFLGKYTEFLENRSKNPQLALLLESINNIGNSPGCWEKILELAEEKSNNSLRLPLEDNKMGALVLFQNELKEDTVKCFWK